MMVFAYLMCLLLLVAFVGTKVGIPKQLGAQLPLLKFVPRVLLVLALVFGGIGTWYGAMFYAEPGYIYHVRTIFGQEKVVSDVGWNSHLFGRINAWKRAMSIVAKEGYASLNEDDTTAESDNGAASAAMGPVRTIFLDQVDAQISATARFMLPTDRESFLKMARDYRSPDNLLRTTLVPAFRETLQANAALMGAEDYFAGKRTQFNLDFEDQLKDGLFLVERREVIRRQASSTPGTANAALETEQKDFGDEEQVVFVVEKITDDAGVPLRKEQSYALLGIQVVESRITDVVPNAKFNERMQLKQKASADRAIAREQRIQEEEQRLLAEAKGEREVAERKAAALVAQIEKTTNAETEKQLAITRATQQKEQAEIDREASQILLEKARIDADAVKVAADAEAYKKKAVIQADNALAQKLETEIEVHRVWADAYAKRSVPSSVFVSGDGGGDTPTGGNTELQAIMQMMTMQMAKQLDYDRQVEK